MLFEKKEASGAEPSILETLVAGGVVPCNAWDKAPSANNLRSKLGIRKATKKASV